MNARAVVSERGTITIPEPVREMAHIHAGDLLEFYPQKDRIIIKHLIVSEAGKEVLGADEWGEFDKAVRKQLKKGSFTSYSNIEKAKLHSRKLLGKS